MTRVLHVFYNFLPDITGSSVRSAGILAGQVANGIEVVAVSSPFQPGVQAVPMEVVNGVRCYRTYVKGNPLISEKGASLGTRIKKVLLFPGFVYSIVRIARTERVTHIHAHSTFYSAAAALVAATLLRVRSVYEFRSLWEERSRKRGLSYMAQSRLATMLETACLRGVDRVVTINEGLRDVLVARGIKQTSITVVPNAVEDRVITEGDALSVPRDVWRFGYVGNLSDIEGLDLLIDAFTSAFPSDERSARLSIHGAGPLESTLRAKISSLGDSRISLHGAFGRSDLTRIYESIDCIVIPRPRSRLTEAVTPLKPLEAMAFGRVVMVSDVAGLVEVTGGSDNATIVTSDSVDAIAAAMTEMASSPADAIRTAESGRRFVRERRNWNGVAREYLEVYA